MCFHSPVIVEIPHFGSMRGKERELIMLRSENGETWKEHHYDCKTEDLNELLNGMDEGKMVINKNCTVIDHASPHDEFQLSVSVN